MARTSPSTSTERSRTDVIVAIAGAHGKIALRLTRLLSADGDSVIGLIRNPDQATDVSDRGGAPVLCDLESASEGQIAAAINGADAAVFAAGAGGGGSAARTLTVDRDGAIKLLRAAAKAGVPRYLIISAGGAEDPPDGDDGLSIYLREGRRRRGRAVERSRMDDRETGPAHRRPRHRSRAPGPDDRPRHGPA